MRKFYLLTLTMWNGSVVINQQSTAFQTEELANKTKKKLEEINKKNNNGISISYKVSECEYYEKEEDVPVLNGK